MRREDEQPREQQPGSTPPGPGGDVAGQVHEEQEQYRALQKERQARVAKVITALAILVVLILFIIANSQPVKVNFVFLTRHPRLIWVMFACAVLGGLFGYLVGRPGRQVHLRGAKRQDKPGKG